MNFQEFLKNRQEKIEDVIRSVLSICDLVYAKVKVDIIKEHPPDNIILEAALDGKVKYVVSYDNHLLNLKEFRGIKIVKPEEFLRVL